jgi:cyclic beta-1,2-glucan synthetase
VDSREAQPERKLKVDTTNAVMVAPPQMDQPIRAEIFGMERLEQHAESLAAAQRTTEKPTRGKNLLARVDDNAKVLLAAYRDIAKTVQEKKEITPAAEWLLDNFHIVDEQIRDIRDHLPKSYYRLLPKIAEGHLAGHPGVYGLAWAYVAHTDSRFQLGTLQPFVRAYQRVQPLTIGEGWAIAIHLRVALVENLRRLARLIVRSRQARASADEMADRLLGLSGRRVEQPEDVLRRVGDAPLVDAFAMQLFQRLRDQDPSVLPVLDWLNEKLGAQGTSADEVVTREQHAQGAANVTVRNIITSMQWMSSLDWTDFFEAISMVDEVLRTVPGFADMDSETRSVCRAQIELLSRGSGQPEIEVARNAVSLARDAGRENGQEARPDAGGVDESAPAHPESWPELADAPRRAEEYPVYYILSQGRLAFEQRLGFRVPLPIRLRRLYRAHAIGGYLGVIATLTAALLSVPLFVTWTAGASLGVLVLLGILGLAPASEIAVSLVNRLVTFLVSPRLHTKLELSQGVPAEFRTVVVVPTFLTSQADIEEQVERLEVHYLANSEGHLHFALLSDWTDASHEHMPGDDELLATLIDSIARLNERYEGPSGGGKRFLLLHRRRLWNEGEGKWIGWERKRGKLNELNRLLRGATDTTFMSIDGQPPTVPQGVRYVITLDADTRLPKGAAYRLIGSIAHPFNRPRFDPQKGRVVDGYGILQPRITPSLPTGPRSTTYQRIVSGPGGVDPYAAAISDVYQDLFEGGSYTGKGIYDVDVFEAALKDKVPENALLSHDLFEGVFARAGLLTDVDLFEEFPANYEVAARRRHRWVRGDWQLLPWILGHARDAAGREQRVHIPTESQWKMVDNLRRSLVAPLSLLVLACAWTLPAVPPLLWAGLIIGSVAVPAFIPVLDNLTPRRARISKRSHLRAVVRDISVASSQTFLGITMLADQAWLMTDAIVRTLGRLYLTRRNLLEWMTAAQADYGADLTPRAFYRDLRWGVVVALGAGSLCAVLKPGAWLVAMPFTLLWVMAPAVAWRISSPSEVTTTQALSTRDMRSLRLIARRTWRFFETFVDQEEHALPLDNFQEDPEPARAHRTSPTNLGLYLLSTMAAHDFGWIGIVETAERLEATLQTMDKMRRIRGHFCNWYDTRDLRPLEPIYVSTVDSGNLAGHLIALAQACRELVHRPAFGPQVLEGVRDALDLVLDSAEQAEHPQRTQTVTAEQLREAAQGMVAALEDPPTAVSEWAQRLEELGAQAEQLLDIARTLSSNIDDGSTSEVFVWATAVRDSIWSHARDIKTAVRFESLDAPQRAETSLGHRLSDLALRAEAMVQAMDFQFLLDPSRKIFSIGYRVADNTLDPSCYDLLASGRRFTPALVPSRPGPDAGGPRGSPRLLVGVDVRVPDAAPGDAAALPQPSRSHLPAGGGASDPVRRGPEGPVGGLRVGLQRSRRSPHVSVLGFRRRRSGLQARAGRGCRRCSLCHRPRRDGRPECRREEFCPPRGDGSPRHIRLL